MTINTTLPCGIARAIVGYAILVGGAWVEVQSVNLRPCESRTFFAPGYGDKHRITVWGLSGGDTDKRRRCQSPTVRTYNITSSLSECIYILYSNNIISIFPFNPAVSCTLTLLVLKLNNNSIEIIFHTLYLDIDMKQVSRSVYYTKNIFHIFWMILAYQKLK